MSGNIMLRRVISFSSTRCDTRHLELDYVSSTAVLLLRVLPIEIMPSYLRKIDAYTRKFACKPGGRHVTACNLSLFLHAT
jgi:hypothetical protein